MARFNQYAKTVQVNLNLDRQEAIIWISECADGLVKSLATKITEKGKNHGQQ